MVPPMMFPPRPGFPPFMPGIPPGYPMPGMPMPGMAPVVPPVAGAEVRMKTIRAFLIVFHQCYYPKDCVLLHAKRNNNS